MLPGIYPWHKWAVKDTQAHCKERCDKEVASYKFCSKNTLKHFSLHDCICSRMFFDGSNIVLDMEWMEVLPSHQNNPYSKAHQSKDGRIVLERPSLDKCTLLPWDEKKNQSRELALEEIDKNLMSN